VEDFITSRPNFSRPNWAGLKDDILRYYDAERMDNRIQLQDLLNYLRQRNTKSINTSQWKKYNRKYLAYAGFLYQNGQLDNNAYHGYFWYGIPESLRNIFELRLQAKNPTVNSTTEPWQISQIEEVAEAHFQRNKFANQLAHLPAIGIKR
jgi:hypothetical protein